MLTPQHHGVVGGGGSFHRQGQPKAGQHRGRAVCKLQGGLLTAKPLQQGGQKNLCCQRKTERMPRQTPYAGLAHAGNGKWAATAYALVVSAEAAARQCGNGLCAEIAFAAR